MDASRTSRWRRTPGEEVTALIIFIPVVVVLAALAWVAWRYMGLRTWQAALCLLLGFLLAATTAAPAIRRALVGIVRSLTGH